MLLPPFISIFVIAATIAFGIFFVMWKRDDWFNFLIKTTLFVLTIWGVLITYDQRLIF